ncbi:diheme cytochrome c [Undibacterium sp. FT137W]|uniref:Diheme cytochrome c n=2 Tax=Undibacterium fentianense TaxID=2828728 RepID=A0A941E0K5_9BURK|nr:diheme cytochrome c [Undibacterium fentianense]
MLGLCSFQLVFADQKTNHAAIPASPKYQQECAACHIAYPAGMLPTASWKRLMNNLPNHFGTDASLDNASVQQISQWLQLYGGTYKRVTSEAPQDRITRSAWFIRKHDEVSAQTWKLAAVKSPSNCMACHQQANLGDFNEHRVRIPR